MKYLSVGSFDVAMGLSEQGKKNFDEIFGVKITCARCEKSFRTKVPATFKCPNCSTDTDQVATDCKK